MARDRPLKYLIDTNVISELRNPAKTHPSVRRWADTIEEDELATSVLVLAEIRLGIELVRRRDRAQAGALDRWLAELRRMFDDRVLPVDGLVAEAWVTLNVPNRMPYMDSLIAATAKVHGLVLVTRDIRHFGRAKIPLLDPFAA